MEFWLSVTKRKGTSKAATARNRSARKSTANATSRESYALICASARSVRIMRLASLVPTSRCSWFKGKLSLRHLLSASWWVNRFHLMSNHCKRSTRAPLIRSFSFRVRELITREDYSLRKARVNLSKRTYGYRLEAKMAALLERKQIMLE